MRSTLQANPATPLAKRDLEHVVESGKVEEALAVLQ